MKEKLVPLIQGPSDTKELHMSRWLNEIRKPESLLAPDLLAFSIQVPQQGDDCRNSGISVLNVWITLFSPLRSSPLHPSPPFIYKSGFSSFSGCGFGVWVCYRH